MIKKQQLDNQSLDAIINEMTNVVEKSKDEIFNISEDSIEELDFMKAELAIIQEKVKEYIDKGDDLKKQVQQSKKKLSLVSSRFDKYTEEEIREVYEQTNSLQTEHALIEKEEKVLRQRRDELERRIIRVSDTIDQANKLGQKVSVVLHYLYDDFSQVNEMVQSAQEKQEFGLKIIEAQEVERKRLSREIHDGPAQSLANILIRSEVVDLAFSTGNTVQALQEMKNVRKNIRSSLKEVRRIIYNLRPMALDDLGLFPTIRKHIEALSKFYDLDIRLKILGDERRLDSAYEVAVFRLIQEAIQNAIKHADATTVQVIIEVIHDKISVVVKDDGIGFDQLKKKFDSFGLVGMKERVELLKGKLVINSKPGEGTIIKFTIPFNEE